MKNISNAVAVIESNDKRLEEYEELLVRRDGLIKEADSYQICYIREFGDIIKENFELKLECIKKKKTISYCIRMINRGLNIETRRMLAEVEKEMTLYYAQLKEMIRENDAAKDSVRVGQYRLERAKKIYRRLAKLLHPDVNSKTMQNKNLQDIWIRIINAYRMSDVDELEDLEVLARKEMEELGENGYEVEYSDIEERIERVERQINDILNTEPYTYGELLKSDERISDLKNQMQEEYDDYKHYLEVLTKELSDMLREGGVKLVWKIK